VQQTIILEVFRQGLFQYRFHSFLINATIWVKHYFVNTSLSKLLRFDKVYVNKWHSIIRPDSIGLYCWFSAVSFNLGVVTHTGVVNHFWKGHK